MLQTLLERIKELTAKMRANIEHRGHLADTLEAMGAKIESLEQRLEAVEGRAVADLTAHIEPPAPVLSAPYAPV